MTTSTDRILDLIDGGLQSSTEHGYGEHVPAGHCARCRRPVADGDLCPLCRAFLLGDTDVDPCAVRDPYGHHVVYGASVRVTRIGDVLSAETVEVILGASPSEEEVEALRAACQHFLDALVPVVQQTARAVADVCEAVVGAFGGLTEALKAADLMPPEDVIAQRRQQARQRELQQLDRHRRSHRRTNRWGPPPGR